LGACHGKASSSGRNSATNIALCWFEAAKLSQIPSSNKGTIGAIVAHGDPEMIILPVMLPH